MPRKNKQLIIIIILFIVIMIGIFYGPFIGVYIYSQSFGKLSISDTAKTISDNETDPKIIINKIADWVNTNMKYDTSQSYFYPFPPFLLQRQVSPSTEWIMTIKRGGCEEYATLFTGVAQSAGIQSRVVYNLAEDHTWSEVFINGSWIHFDPMLSTESRFNNTAFYERPRSEGGWGKQLSYVFFMDRNGKQQDITSKYTDTGRLVVSVTKDGAPIENARVVVESRFLMEKYPAYKDPIPVLENFTNKSGLCAFNLGGNDYTIIAETGQIIGYKDETIISLKENNTTSVELHPTKLALLLPVTELLLSAIVITLSISVGYLAVMIRRRIMHRL